MRVAVVAGGRSSEHEISLESARSVLNGLEEGGHVVEPIVVGRDGIWREMDPRGSGAERGRPVAIVPGGAGASLLHIEEEEEVESEVDVVFPVLHGPFGEDGTVQGLLECAAVPYVGAGVLASALCIDKVAFKAMLRAAGLPQPAYMTVSETEFSDDGESVRRRAGELGFPLFVKPASLGSSVGISKVQDGQGLGRALAAAFAHDPKAVVEEGVRGKEVECSVIGTVNPLASVPGEIRANAEWYDYEAKYAEGGMSLIVPADVPPDVQKRIQDLAADVFLETGCEGLARVDFFVRDGAEILVNELNTIPGFTSTSVFARLFEASGVKYVELLDKLLGFALERQVKRSRYKF